MRVSAPANKAAPAGSHGRFLQIAGPLMIGVFGVGALGTGIAWRAPSSTRGTGCTQCFVNLAAAVLNSGSPVRAHEVGTSEGRAPRRVVHVEVGEGLGRPSLVSIDIIMVFSDALSEHGAATRALGAITWVTWGNPEITSVSVRTRVLLAHDEAGDLEASDAQTGTIVDMSAPGLAGEIVHPGELYDRYGAPEYDPVWRL